LIDLDPRVDCTGELAAELLAAEVEIDVSYRAGTAGWLDSRSASRWPG